MIPQFLKVNPPKQGLFHSKQGSFGFQVVGGWTNLSEKICSSNWIISPGRGERKNMFETTGHVERAVLVSKPPPSIFSYSAIWGHEIQKLKVFTWDAIVANEGFRSTL